MSLSHSQKKYIKNNIQKFSISEISAHLHLDEEVVHKYLKDKWTDEKYNKFVNRGTKPNATPVMKAFPYSDWLYFIVFFSIVILSYGLTLNAAFVSDDIPGIVNNRDILNLQSVFSLATGFFRPLIYYFIVTIGGINPFLFRLINVLLHIGCVWFVYKILRQLSTQNVAFFTALLFAVHPILTESITWISAGSYPLYSLFFLISFYLYISARESLRSYALSFFFFVLSLLSSEKAVVLPVILVLYHISFGSFKSNYKKLIPYFIFAFLWGGLLALNIGSRLTSFQSDFYQDTTAYNPFSQIPVAITSYIRLIAWPDALTLYHSEEGYMSQFELFFRIIAFIIFLALTFYSYFKNRHIFFWLSFFVITLLPTLTPFGIAWVVAERYVYLGSIGVIFVFSYFLNKLIENRKYQTFGALVLAFVLIGLTVRTITRNMDWRSEDTLYLSTAKASPSDPKTHNNLGDVYGRQGDLPRAVQEFQIAIKLNPRYADAHHNLGNTYKEMGKNDEARQSYSKAIEYNPRLWQSYQNIAAIDYEEKKYAQAEEQMKKGLIASPNNISLYSGLGVIYLTTNRKTEAKEIFMKVLELDPNNAQAKQGLQEAMK